MNLCLLHCFSVDLILKSLVSQKDLRELNALRALPVHPVFANEKSLNYSSNISSFFVLAQELDKP